MTNEEYREIISRLGCNTAAQAAELIGCCERMARYYAKGNPIPLVVAKRLRSEVELRRLRNVVERLRLKRQSDSGEAIKLMGGQF